MGDRPYGVSSPGPDRSHYFKVPKFVHNRLGLIDTYPPNRARAGPIKLISYLTGQAWDRLYRPPTLDGSV